MATYADNHAARERAGRKRAQDDSLRSLHRQFDLSAGDTRMKYERPSFAVVTASEEFRAGWDRTFGSAKNPKDSDRIFGTTPCEPPVEKPANEPPPSSTAA